MKVFYTMSVIFVQASLTATHNKINPLAFPILSIIPIVAMIFLQKLPPPQTPNSNDK